MKKVYTKPEIFFDSFELSQSIAAGCELIASNLARYSCPLTPKDLGEDYTIFVQGACIYEGQDTICYDVPQADYNVYTS